jgi:hypothetical protein
LISCEKEVDIDNKLDNCFIITCIMKDMFRPHRTLKRNKNKTSPSRCYTAAKIGLLKQQMQEEEEQQQ